MTKHIDKFYYPCCKEIGCDGVLKIKINDDFSIAYECEKNDKHIKKKIYFKTFERFYLKEKLIDNCSKCNYNIENDIYKCTKCKDIYCCYCFKSDEHIKKDYNYLSIFNKKCLIHKRELIQYCLDCKKYLCVYCLKDDGDENNIHKEHYLICLIDLIPTQKEVNDLKYKIEQRARKYKELINSLDEWIKKLNNKIEELKNNLQYEIELMKKLFYNYNIYFLNYTYFKNFEYLVNYLESINSKNYNQCYSFEDLRDILEKLFNPKKEEEQEIIPKKAKFIHSYPISDGLLFKINNENFFSYSYADDDVKIVNINEDNKIKSLEKTIIGFQRKIYSVSLSRKNDKIFACLKNQKLIKIFNFNLENKLMEESQEEIVDILDDSDGRFNKCIEISDDLLVASDNYYNIIVWKMEDTNKYNNHNRISLNTETCDLLLINDEYFVSSQPNKDTITFFKIEDFSKEKTIEKIDSIDSNNTLFLYKEFILVNCSGGLALIYIKTKEYIQYIENDIDDVVQSKKGLFVYNDYIYILNKMDYNNSEQTIYIKVITFEDNLIKLIDEYEESNIDDNGIIKLMVMSKDSLILWGNKVNILEK